MSTNEFLPTLESQLSQSDNPIRDYDNFCFASDAPYEQKKKWLGEFIHKNFGIWIPDKAVCSNHCAPLDFVADVFFQKVQSALAVANRDGGKTFDFAVLHALNSRFYDGCETASIGAIEEQAKKCYSYFKQFIKAPALQHIYNDPLIMETILKNGSKVKIAPGTINALNSPHPHKSFFDEVELTKWNVLQEFFSMSKSEVGGTIKAADVLGSTRKYSYGVIQQLMDEIQSGNMPGFHIYMWCIWEVAETFELEESWREITKPTKDGRISFYDLATPYAGRTNGFYPITDIVKKFSSMSFDTWQTQWACEKPSKEGLVFGNEFDEADILPANWRYNPLYQAFAGQDFGDNDPMVTEYAQLLPDYKTVVIYDESWINKLSASKFAKNFIIPKDKTYPSLEWTCYDPSGAGYAREMQDAKNEAESYVGTFIPSQIPPPEKIMTSIQLLKHLFEEHRIKISPNCVNLIRELRAYHYLPGTDKPEDCDNHTIDALRYMLFKLFGVEDVEDRDVYGMPTLSGSSNRLI